MTTTAFIYTTYIAAPAEKIWQAITRPEISRRYWGGDNRSDWKAGSPWEHVVEQDGKPTRRVAGSVVEATPPKRLVLSWAAPDEVADRAKHSRVTFELEPVGDLMVRLTVTHDELQAGSEMARKISGGWPRVLSSLKTFLETGKPLETWAANTDSCASSH